MRHLQLKLTSGDISAACASLVQVICKALFFWCIWSRAERCDSPQGIACCLRPECSDDACCMVTQTVQEVPTGVVAKCCKGCKNEEFSATNQVFITSYIAQSLGFGLFRCVQSLRAIVNDYCTNHKHECTKNPELICTLTPQCVGYSLCLKAGHQALAGLHQQLERR